MELIYREEGGNRFTMTKMKSPEISRFGK